MKLLHFARRLRESLPLGNVADSDRVWVRSVLSDSEWELWLSMQRMDERHSLGVARRLLDSHPEVERHEIAAALLHDVGKARSRLGVSARVLTTIVGPRSRRWREYHDHERIGFEMCRDRNVDQRVCDLILGEGCRESVERLRRADDL